MLTCLVALTVLLSGTGVQAQRADDKVVGISGKTDPGKIPDYLVWMLAFRYFQDLRSAPALVLNSFRADLKFSPEAFALLLDTATKAKSSDEANAKEIAEKKRQLLAEGAKVEAVVTASKAGISVTVPKADLAFFRLPR